MRPEPWFAIYNNNYSNTALKNTEKIVIIGGGISGVSTAFALAKRGYRVKLYEKNSTLASGASGNLQAILYGSFSGDYTPMLELSLSGYSYSQNLIRDQLNLNIDYQSCGIIQLAHNNHEKQKQLQMLKYPKHLLPNLFYKVSQSQIEYLSNLKTNCDQGIFFPNGIWLNPIKLINKLSQHPNIEVVTNQEITQLQYIDSEYIDDDHVNNKDDTANHSNNKNNSYWRIYDQSKLLDITKNIVICNSYNLSQFAQTKKIPLRKIRGQITQIGEGIDLKTIICGNGYITPPNSAGIMTIGATFKFNTDDDSIKNQEHLENLNHMAAMLPSLQQQNYTQIQGRVSFRSTTNDYMPLVGPIADYNKFILQYEMLKKDKNYWVDIPCPYLPGLFLNTAHGSKGMLTSPISGEIIADYISNEFSYCSERVRKSLHPNRFWLKQIIRHAISE